jgi:hypothetical protein
MCPCLTDEKNCYCVVLMLVLAPRAVIVLNDDASPAMRSMATRRHIMPIHACIARVAMNRSIVKYLTSH